MSSPCCSRIATSNATATACVTAGGWCEVDRCRHRLTAGRRTEMSLTVTYGQYWFAVGEAVKVSVRATSNNGEHGEVVRRQRGKRENLYYVRLPSEDQPVLFLEWEL